MDAAIAPSTCVHRLPVPNDQLITRSCNLGNSWLSWDFPAQWLNNVPPFDGATAVKVQCRRSFLNTVTYLQVSEAVIFALLGYYAA